MPTFCSPNLWALIVIVCSAGCSLPRFSATGTHSQMVEVDGPASIDLTTFNGSITVKSHALSELTIETKTKAYGNTQQEADELIEKLIPTIDTTSESVVISVPRVSRPGISTGMASVSFALSVPPTSKLMLKTSNGAVEVIGVDGPIDIQTSNGTVHVVSARGNIRVSTSNGKVDLHSCTGHITAESSNGQILMANCTLEGECQATTSNGGITVQLPTAFRAEVSARTSNGTVRCELPTDGDSNGKQNRKGKSFSATVNPGSNTDDKLPKLRLETSNGGINIETYKNEGSGATEQKETLKSEA